MLIGSDGVDEITDILRGGRLKVEQCCLKIILKPHFIAVHANGIFYTITITFAVVLS